MIDGRQTWSGPRTVPRHRHPEAYAALILAGGYEESGTHGRYHVRAGQVLLHRPFDAHVNRFPSGGAHILNIKLRTSPSFGSGRIGDPDAIVRLAETDLAAAEQELQAQLRPDAGHPLDWPDVLARDLLADPQLRLEAWAARHRLTTETLSRGFGKVFCTSPRTFRAEVRALRALGLIAESSTPLVAIASQTGFADQAHMTRAVRQLTGQPPGEWRGVNSVQDVRARRRL
ncbi:MAG TPA: AraC family transcriptional regulator [Steroidobacteraceae bacterium]|nr:AraC family transcriptional regulator [Steroidobacteraceae bacterium]